MTSGKVIATTSTLWIASSVDQVCLFYFLLPCDTKKKVSFFSFLSHKFFSPAFEDWILAGFQKFFERNNYVHPYSTGKGL